MVDRSYKQRVTIRNNQVREREGVGIHIASDFEENQGK